MRCFSASRGVSWRNEEKAFLDEIKKTISNEIMKSMWLFIKRTHPQPLPKAFGRDFHKKCCESTHP